MSELKVHKIGDLCFDFKMGKDVGIDFYLKSEADKVIEKKDEEIDKQKWRGDEWAKACNQKDKEIAELKAKNMVLQSFYDLHGNVDNNINQLKAENERLKKELEHVKNGDCINTCDVLEKYGKELLHTRRALWLARAERAKEKQQLFHFSLNYQTLTIEGFYDPYKVCRMLSPKKWIKIFNNIEIKCRAKADKFKEDK